MSSVVKGYNGVSRKQFIASCREDLFESFREYRASSDKGNSYLMRFHRCYISGDYGSYSDSSKGEQMYKMYRGQAQRNMKPNGYRQMAITTFRAFIGIEFYDRLSMPTTQELEDMLTLALEDQKDEFINGLIENIKMLAEN